MKPQACLDSRNAQDEGEWLSIHQDAGKTIAPESLLLLNNHEAVTATRICKVEPTHITRNQAIHILATGIAGKIPLAGWKYKGAL